MAIQNGMIPLAIYDNTDLYTGGLYGTRFGAFIPSKDVQATPIGNNTAYGVTVNPLDTSISAIQADAICLDEYSYIFSLESYSSGGKTLTKINIFKSKNVDKTFELKATQTYDASEILPYSIGMVVYNAVKEEFRFVVGNTLGDMSIFKYSDMSGLGLIGKPSIDTSLLGDIVNKEAEIKKIKEAKIGTELLSNRTVNGYKGNLFCDTGETVGVMYSIASLSRSITINSVSVRLHYYFINDLFNGNIIAVPFNESVYIKNNTEVVNKLTLTSSTETNGLVAKLFNWRDGKFTFIKAIQKYGQISNDNGATIYSSGSITAEYQKGTVGETEVNQYIAYKLDYNYNDKYAMNDSKNTGLVCIKRIDNEWQVYMVDGNKTRILACNTNQKTITSVSMLNFAADSNNYVENNAPTVPILGIGTGDNRLINPLNGQGTASDYRINRNTFRQYTSIKAVGAQEKIWVERGENWRCSKEGGAVYFEVLENNINILAYVSTAGTPAPVDCYIGMLAGKGGMVITKQTGIKFK